MQPPEDRDKSRWMALTTAAIEGLGREIDPDRGQSYLAYLGLIATGR
jgi:hypothetical protein